MIFLKPVGISLRAVLLMLTKIDQLALYVYNFSL